MPRQRTVDQLHEPPEVVQPALIEAKDLHGFRNIIVHGEVVGDGEVQGAVFLGPQGYWRGDLTAEIVVIKGRLEGNVVAHQKLEVRPTAQIRGTLTSPLVAIGKGARIEGDIMPPSCVIHFEERRG